MNQEEHEKLLQHEAQRAHDYVRTMISDFNKAAVDGANIALKGLLVVNGGAVIALLGFLASLASSQGGLGLLVPAVAKPLVLFAWGAALSVLASAGAYLTNYMYCSSVADWTLSFSHPFIAETASSKRWSFWGKIVHVITFLVGLASVAMMGLGINAVGTALPIVFSAAP